MSLCCASYSIAHRSGLFIGSGKWGCQRCRAGIGLHIRVCAVKELPGVGDAPARPSCNAFRGYFWCLDILQSISRACATPRWHPKLLEYGEAWFAELPINQYRPVLDSWRHAQFSFDGDVAPAKTLWDSPFVCKLFLQSTS